MDINPYETLQSFAIKTLALQEIRPGDYTGADGLLICGTCGRPRQTYIEIENPLPGNPTNMGKVITADACLCDLEERRKREEAEQKQKDAEAVVALKQLSLMDEKFKSSTFENYNVTKYNERNHKLCVRYAERFEKMFENNQGLLFWGASSTGKTFSAACIANYLLNNKTPVIMTSFVRLIDMIYSGKIEESSLLHRMNTAKLLILDDLGAERDTGFAIEKVYSIIDNRDRQNRPMILTTNLTLEEMKNEEDIRYKRIYERILATCYPMQFTGPSWRIKSASERYNEMQKLLEE